MIIQNSSCFLFFYRRLGALLYVRRSETSVIIYGHLEFSGRRRRVLLHYQIGPYPAFVLASPLR